MGNNLAVFPHPIHHRAITASFSPLSSPFVQPFHASRRFRWIQPDILCVCVCMCVHLFRLKQERERKKEKNKEFGTRGSKATVIGP